MLVRYTGGLAGIEVDRPEGTIVLAAGAAVDVPDDLAAELVADGRVEAVKTKTKEA